MPKPKNIAPDFSYTQKRNACVLHSLNILDLIFVGISFDQNYLNNFSKQIDREYDFINNNTNDDPNKGEGIPINKALTRTLRLCLGTVQSRDLSRRQGLTEDQEQTLATLLTTDQDEDGQAFQFFLNEVDASVIEDVTGAYLNRTTINADDFITSLRRKSANVSIDQQFHDNVINPLTQSKSSMGFLITYNGHTVAVAKHNNKYYYFNSLVGLYIANDEKSFWNLIKEKIIDGNAEVNIFKIDSINRNFPADNLNRNNTNNAPLNN